MTNERYPVETLRESQDDGTMPENVAELEQAVVGRRIVSAETDSSADVSYSYGYGPKLILTLDDGRNVSLKGRGDCCAYTELESFFLDPNAVDHMILGVGTTDEYSTWHIFADFGDIMKLEVDWSAGNVGYYVYGFSIEVEDV